MPDFRVFGIFLCICSSTRILLVGLVLGGRPEEGGTVNLLFAVFAGAFVSLGTKNLSMVWLPATIRLSFDLIGLLS